MKICPNCQALHSDDYDNCVNCTEELVEKWLESPSGKMNNTREFVCSYGTQNGRPVLNCRPISGSQNAPL